MNRKSNKLIQYFAVRQKTLFLIDSFGAFFTAFFLFVILRQYNFYFGMPKTVLTYLSLIAILFCVFSISCYILLKSDWSIYLRIIGVSNLLYCTLTLFLIIKNYPILTKIGTIYFLSEIVIIIGLSYIELKVATRIKKSNSLDAF